MSGSRKLTVPSPKSNHERSLSIASSVDSACNDEYDGPFFKDQKGPDSARSSDNLLLENLTFAVPKVASFCGSSVPIAYLKKYNEGIEISDLCVYNGSLRLFSHVSEREKKGIDKSKSCTIHERDMRVLPEMNEDSEFRIFVKLNSQKKDLIHMFVTLVPHPIARSASQVLKKTSVSSDSLSSEVLNRRKESFPFPSHVKGDSDKDFSGTFTFRSPIVEENEKLEQPKTQIVSELERDGDGGLITQTAKCVIQLPKKMFRRYTSEKGMRIQQTWVALNERGSFIFKFSFSYCLLPTPMDEITESCESCVFFRKKSKEQGNDHSSYVDNACTAHKPTTWPPWKKEILKRLTQRNATQTHSFVQIFKERVNLLRKLRGWEPEEEPLLQTEGVEDNFIRGIELSMDTFLQRGKKMEHIYNQVQTSYFEAVDHAKVAYRIYAANKRKEVGVVVIFCGSPLLKTKVSEIFPAEISARWGIKTYVFYPRGVLETGLMKPVRTQKVLLKDVRGLVRLVKWHNPGKRIILGGVNLGGALMMNYSSWSRREKVDGVFVVSPAAKDIMTAYEKQVVSIKDHFIHLAVYLKLSRVLAKIPVSQTTFTEGLEIYRPILSEACMEGNFTLTVSVLLACGLLNFKGSLKKMDVPLLLIAGTKDEVTKHRKVLGAANSVFGRPSCPSKSQILTFENATHFSVLHYCDSSVAEWCRTI
eukprot:Nk52_evm11s1401 gene=Nk52_evmTU11s1401